MIKPLGQIHIPFNPFLEKGLLFVARYIMKIAYKK